MNTNTANALMTLEIFDPPMCCPGGMCGPAIDPALLDINEAILKLKKELEGTLEVERYLLSQQGQKFMQVPDVLTLLKREGVSVLPITMLNGKIVKQKSYPTYDELRLAIKERVR